VLNLFTIPGVGYVYAAIGPLDDGRVGEFAGLGFEGEKVVPFIAGGAYSQIQRSASLLSVIVDQEDPAIFEPDGVDTAIGIG
jgi:hypothetical protein